MIIFEHAEFHPYIRTLEQNCPKIAIPAYDPVFLSNLVHTLYARGELLNRICGHPGAFVIMRRLIRSLHDHKPCCSAEFFDLLRVNGGKKFCKGLVFLPDKILFSGFSHCEDMELLRFLVKRIHTVCLTHKIIHQ